MYRFVYLYAGMLVLAAWLASASGLPSLFHIPDDVDKLWVSLLAGVGLGLAVVVVGIGMERVTWYREMAAFLKRMITSPELLGPKLDSQKAFVIAAYSSVGEEALFRGFVQPWLIRQVEGVFDAPETVLATGLGIVLTSLIFGLLHFPVVKELRAWTGFAVLAGVLFGILAAWSECLLAPVLAHLVINWLNLKRLVDFPLEAPSL